MDLTTIIAIISAIVTIIATLLPFLQDIIKLFQ